MDDDYDDCDDDADDDIVNSVLVDNLKKEISELRGVISQLQSSNSQLQAKVDFFFCHSLVLPNHQLFLLTQQARGAHSQCHWELALRPVPPSV